jgi:capsular exopolysaccharide synthesis family protein
MTSESSVAPFHLPHHADKRDRYPDLLQIVRRHKTLIVLSVIVGLGLGTLFYRLKSPTYQSTAQLVVHKKRSETVPNMEYQQQAEDFLSTHVQIIKSPMILSRAIEEHNLAGLESYRTSQDVVLDITQGLTVLRDLKDGSGRFNNVVNLTCKTRTPEDSATVLEAIIDSYRKYLAETYRSVSDQTVELIITSAKELRKELEQKEAAYRDFRLKTPVMLIKSRDGNYLNMEDILTLHQKQAEVRMRRAEVERCLKEAEKALKEEGGKEKLIALVTEFASQHSLELSRPHSVGLEERLMPSLLEEKVLTEDLGPKHPQVLAARKRTEVAAALVVEAIRQEVNKVRASEQELEAVLHQKEQQAKDTVAFDVRDQTQRQDLLRLEQQYDDIKKRLSEVNLVKEFGGYEMRVVAPPEPGMKASPKAVITFPVALLMGLMVGFGLAYLVDLGDRSFHSVEEVRRHLGLPVLGQVPFSRAEAKRLARAKDPATALAVWVRPRSGEAEAYRCVRTALCFSTRAGGQKVLQVTSPHSGDGKTLLAANLAASLAQSSKRVLLVDADLHRPHLHALFGVPGDAGLTSVIVGECGLAEAVSATSVPGLSVLPCGPVPSNPAELLSSPRFAELLAGLRGQYDAVVVDTPPLLAVSDAAVVAAQADGVVLVLRPGKNSRPAADRAVDALRAVAARVLGIVVNGGAMESHLVVDYGRRPALDPLQRPSTNGHDTARHGATI